MLNVVSGIRSEGISLNSPGVPPKFAASMIKVISGLILTASSITFSGLSPALMQSILLPKFSRLSKI